MAKLSPPIRPRPQLKISLPAVPRRGSRNATNSRSADGLPVAVSSLESRVRTTSRALDTSAAASHKSSDQFLLSPTPAPSRSSTWCYRKQGNPKSIQEIFQPPAPYNRNGYYSSPQDPEALAEPDVSCAPSQDQDEADPAHPGVPVLVDLYKEPATPTTAHPGVPISLKSTVLSPTVPPHSSPLPHFPPSSLSRLGTSAHLSKSPELATQERLYAWARAKFEDLVDNIRICSSVTVVQLLAVSRADSRSEGVKACAVFLRAPVIFERVAGALWETLHGDGVEEFMREYQSDEGGSGDESEDVSCAEADRLGKHINHKCSSSCFDGPGCPSLMTGLEMDGGTDLFSHGAEDSPEKEEGGVQSDSEAYTTPREKFPGVMFDSKESSKNIYSIPRPAAKRMGTESLLWTTSMGENAKNPGPVRHRSQSHIDGLKGHSTSKSTKGWWPRVMPQSRGQRRRPERRVTTIGFREDRGMGVQQPQEALKREAKREARQPGNSMGGKVWQAINKVELKISRGVMV